MDMSMGAASRGGVDGTAMAAEKTGLTWPLDWSGGRLLSSRGEVGQLQVPKSSGSLKKHPGVGNRWE